MKGYVVDFHEGRTIDELQLKFCEYIEEHFVGDMAQLDIQHLPIVDVNGIVVYQGIASLQTVVKFSYTITILPHSGEKVQKTCDLS